MEAAIIGLGIDEYGNFLNPGDNTNTGPGYVPLRIGMRGPGSTTWNWLNTNYPVQYPSIGLTNAQKSAAVQQACKTGLVWDWSQVAATGSGTSVAYTPTTQLTNYAFIKGAASVLPASELIAVESVNGSNILRSQATPITYNVKITTGGLLSFSYSYNGGANLNVITSQDIRLKDPLGNPLPLPANVRFGFAGSTGGSTNIHEIMCFQATPTNTSQSSAGLNQKQTAKVQIGTQVYFAFYNPSTLAGLPDLPVSRSRRDESQLAQHRFRHYLGRFLRPDRRRRLANAIRPMARRERSTGAALGEPRPDHDDLGRQNKVGIPFEWTSLQATEQAALDAGDAAAATAVPPNAPPLAYSRLNYLRGYRGDEQTPASATTFTGVYRDRTSVLGDIIDSSPTWVGPPSSPYPATWSDALHATGDPLTGEFRRRHEVRGTSRQAATGGFQTRTNVVYAGANDGFLHGFRSGNYDNTNTYVKANNDGTEVLAYMPRHIVDTIQTASATTPSVYNSVSNFSDPQYGHKFDVDAPPGTGDLFYSNTWHTWLIGGLGAGGPAIYALDVTDPDNSFPASRKQCAPTNVVKGEWSTITLRSPAINVTRRTLPGAVVVGAQLFGQHLRRAADPPLSQRQLGRGLRQRLRQRDRRCRHLRDAGRTQQRERVTFYYLEHRQVGHRGIPTALRAYVPHAGRPRRRSHHRLCVRRGPARQYLALRFDQHQSRQAWAVTPTPLFTTASGDNPSRHKVAVASVARVPATSQRA